MFIELWSNQRPYRRSEERKLKLSCLRQDSFRSSERRCRKVRLRTIDMSPLRGEEYCISNTKPRERGEHILAFRQQSLS